MFLSNIDCLIASTTTPVEIGFQQTQYTVLENVENQFVCVEIQSGEVAGRDIELYHTVENSGMDMSYMFTQQCLD